MHTYEAILWDFDGTLVDSEPLHASSWREALGQFDVTVDTHQFLQRFVGIEDRDVIRQIAVEQQPPRSFDDLWRAFPIKQQIFLQAVPATLIVPEETRQLLAQLQSLGFPLGLVTSSSRDEVQPVLDRNGIGEHFDVRIFAESVNHKKPHPEPYLLAKSQLGVERALVMEDSNAGYTSATAAGCEVIRVQSVEAAAAQLRAHLGL